MQYLKGDKIFDGEKFLPPASVLVYDDQNLLKDIVRDDQVDAGTIRSLEGILTPGFVNTHCHLELSHMKGRIAQHTGLPGFGKQVITQRDRFSEAEILEAMREADREMLGKGIVAVGDISNNSTGIPVKKASPLYYHTLVELLSLNPAQAKTVAEQGLALQDLYRQSGLPASLVPHAPYSVSLELFDTIARLDERHGLPFSLHNQESPEEDKFFRGAQGGFRELYHFLGLDISFFIPPRTSSLQYFAAHLPASGTILVHNTFTTAEDIATVNGKNVFWCFCPSANLYIENAQPDYRLFATQADRICLGTDSLASNSGLDLVQEANHILEAGGFSVPEILKALCVNGAAALGIGDSYGSLLKGRNTGLNQLSIHNGRLKFQKKIF